MADIQADGGEDLSAAYSPDARHVLHVCGNPLGINGEILAGIKIFFAALFAGTGAFLSAGRYLFPVASLSLLFGYAFPGILIQRSIRIRRESAERQLTDAIDLLVVSVEA